MPTLVNSTEKSEQDKARFNLKNSGIKAKLDKTGNLTFVVPKSLEEKLRREYNFSLDMLSVGGDIPLPELAIHCDEQSSKEAEIGLLAEFVRYQLMQAEDKYDAWYWSEFSKIKTFMLEKGDKHITDKTIESKIKTKKMYLKRRQKINELSMQYRILNNVIKASIVTKGTLLGTIRNIIQGKDGHGIGSIKIKTANKTRKKLQLKK